MRNYETPRLTGHGRAAAITLGSGGSSIEQSFPQTKVNAATADGTGSNLGKTKSLLSGNFVAETSGET